MNSSKTPIKSPFAFGLLVIVLTACATWAYWVRPWESAQVVKLHTVGTVSFTQHVRERGYVAPARVVKIRSEIPSNQAKLVWLAEEGKAYKKGNLVAQFDTKPFMDKLEKADQVFVDAQAKVGNAEQALKLQREENQARLEAVERKLEIARIKADDLRNGTGQLTRQKLELAIEQAKRQHRIAKAEQLDYDELLNTGHVSQREHDKIADAATKASEALEIAQADLDNFNRYEMPRLLREAELLLDEADSEKARVVRTTTLELKQSETDLSKRRYDLEIARAAVQKARNDVKNCDVRAPIDGTLLYLDLPRERQKQKPQLGDAIWFRQAFMAVPDTRELIVEIHIREIDMARVAAGAKTDIELDAFPGMVHSGELLSIGSIAEDSESESSIRRFRGRVRFAEAPPQVHVGMSANVKILIRELNDVLAVPVEAILYRDGQAGVITQAGESRKWQAIDTGAVGSRWVEVLDGVSEGTSIRVGAH